MSSSWPVTAALLTALCPALAAQDSSVALSPYLLVITEHGTEIGREQVSLRGDRRGQPGTTLSVTARYPAPRPRIQLSGVIERHPDGTLAAAQFDLQTPEHASRTYAEVSSGRLTVRTASEGRESAREYPAGLRTVVLDDSLYGPWLAVAALAGSRESQVTALFPRSGRKASLTIRRQATPAGGMRVEVSGALSATVEVARNGRLLLVILPGRGIEAAPAAP